MNARSNQTVSPAAALPLHASVGTAKPVPVRSIASSRARWRVAAEVAAGFIIAAALTVLSLRASLQDGRLAIPPTYDDVGYLLLGRSWIAGLADRPLAASLYQLIDQHAPVWTWFSILGFWLAPARWIGPYALTGLAFAGFYFGLLRMMRAWPFLVAVSAAIVVGQIQFLYQAATEFRPDILHGAYLGLCAVCMVGRPFLPRPAREQLGFGLFAGLILIMKPTACLPSAALIGASLMIRLALDMREDAEGWSSAFLRRVARAIGLVAVGTIVVAGPVFVVRAQVLFTYIYDNFFAGRSADWVWDASLSDHLRFYADGIAGSLALGGALWVCLATFAVRLAIAVWRRRDDLVPLGALAGVVAISFAIPNATLIKTYFLGSMFYATLTVAAVANVLVVSRCWAGVFRAPPSSARAVVLSAALLLALGSAWHVVAAPPLLSTRVTPREAENMRRATDWAWGIVRVRAPERGSPERPTRVVLGSPYPISQPVLDLYAVGDNRMVDTGQLFHHRTLESALEYAATFDLLIIASSTVSNLPGPRLGDDIMRALDASADYAVVDSFDQVIGGMVRIYERRRR